VARFPANCVTVASLLFCFLTTVPASLQRLPHLVVDPFGGPPTGEPRARGERRTAE